MSLRILSKVLLVCSAVLATYLSLAKLGGLMVLGFSDFLEFSLIGLPVLALPVQAVAFWKLRNGATLFCLLTIWYLVIQIHIVGFSPAQISKGNSHVSLYVLTSILLIGAVIADRKVTAESE